MENDWGTQPLACTHTHMCTRRNIVHTYTIYQIHVRLSISHELFVLRCILEHIIKNIENECKDQEEKFCDMTWLSHSWAHSRCCYCHKTRPDQPRQNSSIRGGEDLETPLFTGDLLTMATYWGKESNSFEDVANGMFPMLQLFLVSYKGHRVRKHVDRDVRELVWPNGG